MPLFVSAVAGATVGRLGSGTAQHKPQQIGAVWAPDTGELEWDEDAVIAISDEEYARHKRHYDRAIAAGDLRKRSADDYAAWLAAQAERGEREKEALEKRRAADQEAARKALEVEREKAEERLKAVQEDVGELADRIRTTWADRERRQLEEALKATAPQKRQDETPPKREMSEADRQTIEAMDAALADAPAPGRGKKGK